MLKPLFFNNGRHEGERRGRRTESRASASHAPVSQCQQPHAWGCAAPTSHSPRWPWAAVMSRAHSIDKQSSTIGNVLAKIWLLDNNSVTLSLFQYFPRATHQFYFNLREL